jgi:hypothetical protein
MGKFERAAFSLVGAKPVTPFFRRGTERQEKGSWTRLPRHGPPDRPGSLMFPPAGRSPRHGPDSTRPSHRGEA